MSFRIHSTPAPAPACMIRVKHHKLPKDLALAQLEADVDYEDEYEDEIETKAAPVQQAQQPQQAHQPHQAQVPLPPVINAVQQVEQPQDETFKLRRKRRV